MVEGQALWNGFLRVDDKNGDPVHELYDKSSGLDPRARLFSIMDHAKLVAAQQQTPLPDYEPSADGAPPLALVGFSKGHVVLNALLSGPPGGAEDTKFFQLVSSLHWVDPGAAVLEDVVYPTGEMLARLGENVKISVDATDFTFFYSTDEENLKKLWKKCSEEGRAKMNMRFSGVARDDLVFPYDLDVGSSCWEQWSCGSIIN